MSLIKKHLLSSQRTDGNPVLDSHRALLPFNSFYDLYPDDWDALLNAVSHLRDLHQRLLLTRLHSHKLKGSGKFLSQLDSLD